MRRVASLQQATARKRGFEHRSGEDVVVWVRSTVCLQRIDDRWLITHEHISFPINPENWNAIVDAAP